MRLVEYLDAQDIYHPAHLKPDAFQFGESYTVASVTGVVYVINYLEDVLAILGSEIREQRKRIRACTKRVSDSEVELLVRFADPRVANTLIDGEVEAYITATIETLMRRITMFNLTQNWDMEDC